MQPKLDGLRMLAVLKDGKCTLWSRTRKPITSLPHIVDAIEKALPGVDIVLDGEAYNHEYKNDFEKIVSLVRQEDPGEGHEVVQYHVYDIVDTTLTFQQRTNKLKHLKERWFDGPLVKVETLQVKSQEEVKAVTSTWLDLGYEGAMIRNADGMYVGKRSYDLQKIKTFKDAEFEIVGIEEGRGKLLGHVGAFICKTENGEEFKAKMAGDTDKLKQYFENHKLWEGKKLTVQYQGLTGKNELPRFPVGVRIRADEDV